MSREPSSLTQESAARIVEALLHNELRDIQQAREDDRGDHKLRQLRQRGGQQHLVEEEYAGRYPFELLQNANDAGANSGEPISARFDVTDSALIISNMGTPFGPEEVKAICDLGESSKDPAKHVGYKGLGFKSVAEITARPQVWSDGVAFEFDTRRVRADVEQILGPIPDQVNLPVFAFPYSCNDAVAGRDADLVARLRRDGYATSIRLPFRESVDRASVAAAVRQLIAPRLLLFLNSLNELIVHGTGDGDFEAIVESEPVIGGVRRVSLLWGGGFEEWLVLQESVDVPEGIRQSFEDAWQRVRQVRVGAAIRTDGVVEDPLPLHVYFPTEVAMPFRALVHGDFMVGLDRRHLKRTAAANNYNDWLAGELGAALARLAIEVSGLSDRPNVLAALAPRGEIAGLAEIVLERAISLLSDAPVVPTLGGAIMRPGGARLLPRGLGPAEDAFDILSLESYAEQLAVLETHRDEDVVQFLMQSLETPRLDAGDAIEVFERVRPEDTFHAYRLLHAWSRRNSEIKRLLPDTRFVLTTEGRRGRPGEVFLPPQAPLRSDWDPTDVELVLLPSETPEDVIDVLDDLGVGTFNRQRIIELQVLPPLTDAATPFEQRQRCHGILAQYLSEGLGDASLRSRLGQVLVRARDAEGEASSEQYCRADQVYFSARWLPEGQLLEQIYGPFGQKEFLAEELRADSDALVADIEYFEQLGVRREPRPLIAETTGRDQYKTNRTWQHPHRKSDPTLFDAWLQSPDVKAASACSLGHPESQQIKRSVTIDRLALLLRKGSRAQRKALLEILAHRWQAAYRSVRLAEFHCQVVGAHGGVNRTRIAPSLMVWLLTREPWVPARVGDETADARSSNVWLLDEAGVTQGAQLLLPTLDIDGVDPVDVRVLGRDIALIAPDTMTVAAGLEQLRQLSKRFEARSLAVDASTRPLRGVARWMLTQLRMASRRSNESVDLSGVPLLTQHGDELAFRTDGYSSPDSNLRNRWRERVPVLLADDAEHTWVSRHGWPDLESSIDVEPRPDGRDIAMSESFASKLETQFPYVAAVATDGSATREPTTLPRLRALKCVVAEEIWLDESIADQTIEPTRVGAYLKSRNERDGSVTRRIGTLFVEKSSTTDFIEIGSQLASYLELPRGEGAALSLVLQDRDTADRYLKSRGISNLVVNELSAKLDSPLDRRSLIVVPPLIPEEGELPPVDGSVGPGGGASGGPDRPIEPVSEPDGHDSEDEPLSTEDELPPLDPEGIRAFDVSVDVVVEMRSARRGGPPERPRSERRRSEKERVEHARSVVRIGDRGEEAAFLYECRRLEEIGRDPLDANWDAERNEWSPYDLTSFDDDGQLVYIEVKATSDADPSRPFKISARQLEYASRYRGSYWIYRVVDTKSATPSVYRYRNPLAQGSFVGDSAMMRLPKLPEEVAEEEAAGE